MFIRNTCLILFSFVGVIFSQLFESEKTQIVKLINDEQSEKSGLYRDDIETTYKAVFSLKVLEEPVPSSAKICRELNYEFGTRAYRSMLELNTLLNCKIEVNAESFLKNFDASQKTSSISLRSILERLEIENTLKVLNEESSQRYLATLSNYFTSDNVFLEYPQGDKEQDSSLLLNSYGLRILGILYSNNQNEVERQNIVNFVSKVVAHINKYFYELKDNNGFYFDGKSQAVLVNAHILEAFANLRSNSAFQDLGERSHKLLNYLFEFKHNYYSVENIYYFLWGLRNLRDWPVFDLEKKAIDEEKFLNLRLLDVFGKENKNANLDISYKIYSEESSEEDATEHKFKFTSGSSSAAIDVKNVASIAGNYFLDIKYNASVQGSTRIRFTVLNKLKIAHIKLSLANAVEKADEKEISVDFPKRSFKSLKATQNSIVKVKVKVNFHDDQSIKLEQILLRLRHSELNKSYSSYSTEYKKLDDYYVIAFDLGDTNLIDPYDGTYEMILMVSDRSLDKPAIWNFGKLDVKFQKPMDPSNVNPSYKNIQKPKMEYYFAPENTRSNFIPSVVFSGVILFVSLLFLKHLNSQGVNLKNLPSKNKTAFLFSIAFVVVLGLWAYIFFLFWVKLNILQTFFILFLLIFPTLFIGYKTLNYIRIDV